MDKSMFDFLDFQNRNMVNNNDIKNCINDNYCVVSSKDNDNSVLTMAFVNMQPLDSVYELEQAFKEGTLFPNINKRFYGGMEKWEKKRNLKEKFVN